MKSKRNPFWIKIRNLFFPQDQIPREGDKEVLPFFALITLALGWMYIIYVQRIEVVFVAVIFTIMMIVHLSLYWAIFRFVHSTRQLRLYFAIQGLMAFALILIGGDFGLAIGLYSSLIGNAAGALRRSLDLITVVFAYLALAVIAIITISGVKVILEWSFVAIPSIVFSGFIALMFRRQLEARAKTQHLLEELQTAHAQLAAYTERVEELTLTTERQRMARELHDTLAQGLTGLVLQLEAVSTHIENQNNPRAQEILHSAMAQSRTTLAEARKVIDDLRSGEQGRQSFLEDIRSEARHLQEMADVPCEVTVNLSRTLSSEIQKHLLKIISEGLYNIAKHAQANHAWLRLTENSTHLVLEIEDDGQGFVPEVEINCDGHYGLLGIHERVDLLQGEFSMDSQPEQGTCLLIQLPLDAEGEEHA